MNKATIYKTITGEITRWGDYTLDEVTATLGDDESFIEGIFNGHDCYVELETVTVKPFPPRTKPHYEFDFTTATWIEPRTIGEIKLARKTYVNTSRMVANQTSFTFEGKEIAVDPLSRSDIDATHGYILINNALPEGWPNGWKCIDNTYVDITTVEKWYQFYTAMVAQGTINFAHAQTLKAAIDAASTVEDVEAVVW